MDDDMKIFDVLVNRIPKFLRLSLSEGFALEIGQTLVIPLPFADGMYAIGECVDLAVLDTTRTSGILIHTLVYSPGNVDARKVHPLWTLKNS